MPRLFILTLDIDETVLNSRTDPSLGFDFNGSEQYNDASGWLSLIEDLEVLCQAQGYKLAIKFLTAKSNGKVDDTVDACHQYFTKHLYLRNKNGEQYKPPTRKSYIVHRHLNGQTLKEMFFNHNFKENKGLSVNGKLLNLGQLMPSIHVCAGNAGAHPTNQSVAMTSKALVLEKIKTFYGVNLEQMLHIDNADWVVKDLQRGDRGATTAFNMVHCYELEKLKLKRKTLRTQAAKNLFEKVKIQVAEQLKQSVELYQPQLPEQELCPVICSETDMLEKRGELQDIYLEVNKEPCLVSAKISIDSIYNSDEMVPPSIQKQIEKMLNEYLAKVVPVVSFPFCTKALFCYFGLFQTPKVLPEEQSSNTMALIKELYDLIQRDQICMVKDVISQIARIEVETLVSTECGEMLSFIRDLLNRSALDQHMERVSLS